MESFKKQPLLFLKGKESWRRSKNETLLEMTQYGYYCSKVFFPNDTTYLQPISDKFLESLKLLWVSVVDMEHHQGKKETTVWHMLKYCSPKMETFFSYCTVIVNSCYHGATGYLLPLSKTHHYYIRLLSYT